MSLLSRIHIWNILSVGIRQVFFKILHKARLGYKKMLVLGDVFERKISVTTAEKQIDVDPNRSLIDDLVPVI